MEHKPVQAPRRARPGQRQPHGARDELQSTSCFWTTPLSLALRRHRQVDLSTGGYVERAAISSGLCGSFCRA
jgi:hypothetical protein